MEIAYREALNGFDRQLCVRRTVIPPNRLETRTWDFIASLIGSHNSDALERLRQELQLLTGREHIFFAPSARCAIARLLSLLPQQEVVMPALTCPVVRTAVQMVGKRILYADIERSTLNATSATYWQYAKPGRSHVAVDDFKVAKRLDRMICDRSRKMIDMKNTVILENVICTGCDMLPGGCPRENYHFWREIWLQRLPTDNGSDRG